MPTASQMQSIETLAGLLEGIAIDDVITEAELDGLRAWYAKHRPTLVKALGPELDAHLRSAVDQRRVSASAQTELLEFCRDFGAKHAPSHPSTRQAFARLQGLLLGLLADGVVEDAELRMLGQWLEDYREFRQHFVFGAFFDVLDRMAQSYHLEDTDRDRVRELCETFAAPPPPRVLPAGFTPAPGPYELKLEGPKWPPLPVVEEADYYTLDLETANDEPSSVCAMGLAAVREGEVIAAGACYVDPRAPFDPRHTRIHGIDANQVRGKGSFAEHWAKVAPVLAGRWVLAHNATFTARCLHALSHTLAPLGAPPRLLCTLRTARRVWPRAGGYSLDHLAEALELTPPTHDPHAGATACAELAQKMCETRGLASPAAVAAELGVGATALSWGS